MNIATNKTIRAVKKTNYHHGDLRQALIDEACIALDRHGIEDLSLRKISEHVGVSRAGAYHHFKNKHELLCVIATQSFVILHQRLLNNLHPDASPRVQLRLLISDYLAYALAYPMRYELMFGRTLWKNSQATAGLKKEAYACFKSYAEHFNRLFQKTASNSNAKNSIAKIAWSSLHGLSRLFIDGIYSNQDETQLIIDQYVELFMLQLTA